jgi:predicted nucleic acid-binding protein
MRIVLDTNVWLSGLLWGGVPAQILQLVEQGQLEAIVRLRRDSHRITPNPRST